MILLYGRLNKAALECGIVGYILKSSSYSEVVSAFHEIILRGICFSPFVLERIISFFREDNSDPISKTRYSILIEQVCRFVDERIDQPEKFPHKKFSQLLESAFHISYNHLSSLFTAQQGGSLREYIIRKRIEKVISLLQEGRFTLTQIAYMTGYSSVSHLSNQFRKFKGMTPSQYIASMIKDTDSP